MISFGPTRVFGGVTGNKVIEFSVKDAAYTWERYNVVTTYKWNRYTIGSKPVYVLDDSDDFSESSKDMVTPITYATKYTVEGNKIRISSSNLKTFTAKYQAGRLDSGYVTSLTGGTQGANGAQTRSPWFYPVAKAGLYDSIMEISGRSFTQAEDPGPESNWYLLGRNRTIRMKIDHYDDVAGTLMDQVTSTSSGAYPSNGISGSYWYVSAGSSTSRGNYIDDVTSQNYNQYPDNGISGSYWYIRK